MYVVGATLGHGDFFNWSVAGDGGLEIRRRFLDGQVIINKYTRDELDRLVAFVQDCQLVDLANNVEKLRKGTEGEGLGQFLKEVLGHSVAGAQAASQLAAIFVKAGVWIDNGRRWGMAFRCMGEPNWAAALFNYYRRQLESQARAALESFEMGEEGRIRVRQLYFYNGGN